jgi:hypothetical protein
MESENSKDKEYTVSVRTNDIQEAIATTGGAFYGLMEEALQLHDHEAEECEFEEFARDVLGVLGRHSDQLITGLRVFCALDKARVMFHRAVACLREEAVPRCLKQRVISNSRGRAVPLSARPAFQEAKGQIFW